MLERVTPVTPELFPGRSTLCAACGWTDAAIWGEVESFTHPSLDMSLDVIHISASSQSSIDSGHSSAIDKINRYGALRCRRTG